MERCFYDLGIAEAGIEAEGVDRMLICTFEVKNVLRAPCWWDVRILVCVVIQVERLWMEWVLEMKGLFIDERRTRWI